MVVSPEASVCIMHRKDACVQVRVWRLPEPCTEPGPDGSTITGASAALYAASVVSLQGAEYVLTLDSGGELRAVADYIFPYDNPVAFGAEEVAPQVRNERRSSLLACLNLAHCSARRFRCVSGLLV